MRRYGLYDATRGLMTALAVGLAGLLLWVATQVGVQSTARFWAAMGIVAAAASCSPCCRLSAAGRAGSGCGSRRGRFCSASCRHSSSTGWILLATQPGNGWHEGRFVSWSHDLGLMGIVHAIGLWHGALAFGFGVVLGMSLDASPVVERVVEQPGRRGASAGRGRAADPGARRRSRPTPSRRATASSPRNSRRFRYGVARFAAPYPHGQGSCGARRRPDRKCGMNAVPHDRGLSLLAAHCLSLDPNAPDGAAAPRRGGRARARAHARLRALGATSRRARRGRGAG